MPCDNCGYLFCVDENKNLFCARCEGKNVETQGTINVRANWFLEEWFSGENLIQIVKNYDKQSLITTLLIRLNNISYTFKEENGLPVDQFRYFPYFLKLIYQSNGFGDQHIKTRNKTPSGIKTLLEGYTEVVDAVRKARDGLNVGIRRTSYRGPWENIPSEYEFYTSERNLCAGRCIASLLCGDFDDYGDYTFVTDNVRSVNKTGVNDVENPWDFGDAWYQLIVQMMAMAAMDEFAGEVFYTDFPEEMTIIKMEEFLDNLDHCLIGNSERMAEESIAVPALSQAQVESSGKLAFGENWNRVRNYVIMSEENPNAHPFLFEMDSIDQWYSDTLEIAFETECKRYLYPRYFSFLLKFQVFPMIKNGCKNDKGHDLLTDLTAKRGKAAEKNLFSILSKRDIEVYHSAELPLEDSHEIDLIYIKDGSLNFIEVKYFRPPIRLESGEGLRIMEENFDEKIFKIENESTSRTPSGKPFPNKVEKWLNRPAGSRFDSKSASGKREHHNLDPKWLDANVNMYVVSNLAPPYLEKEGVRFLTDIEFLDLLSSGPEDVLIDIPNKE